VQHVGNFVYVASQRHNIHKTISLHLLVSKQPLLKQYIYLSYGHVS